MRIEYKIITLSILCGLSVWLIDAYVGYKFFNEGTFGDLLFTNAPAHEIYIRTSISGLFIAFGVLASRCIAKRRKAEKTAQKSLNFLQTIIDGIPDGVMVIDLNHRVVLANSTNKKLAEGRSKVAGPMLCYEVSHHRSTPCDGLEHPCPLKQVVETQQTVTATHVHFTDDGDEVIMEIRAAPVFNEAGKVVQIIESFRDVTERQRAAEQLRQQRDRAQKYLDIAGVILIVLNVDGTVALINKKGCEILGWKEQQIVGRHWFDNFLPENIRQTVKADFRKLMAGNIGPVEYYENPVIRKDGGQRLIAWHNTLLKDAAGNITGTLSSGEDITNRKQTELALQKSEEQFRAIFEHALVGMYRTTPNGQILMANPALVKMMGYSSFEELSRRDLEKEGYESRYPRSIFKKHIETEGKVVGLESAWLRSDGTALYVRESAQTVRDERGNILYYEGTVEDVTERRQADAELKRASVFLDSMSEALSVADSELKIIRVNEAACKLWGYSRKEMLGKSVTELFAHQEASTHGHQEQLSALSGSAGEFETIALTKDGRTVPVSVSGRGLKDERGSVTSFIAVVRDITERKWAEQALMRYQTQLRSLVSQLTMTEERERKEIEAAIHDDLLQKLALCKMRLDELSQSESQKDHTNSLHEIAESVREMIRSTRSLTFDLTSPVLYDIGLEAAIRDWLDREVSGKYDIVFEFEDDGQSRKLGNDLRVMLYRAVRELCTNIIKHSRAKRAKVQVRNNRNNMEIIVEDDGVGIEYHNAGNDTGDFGYRGGLGLFGIRERLDHFGARMKIDSEIGAGTRISIIVPSHPQETAEKTRY